MIYDILSQKLQSAGYQPGRTLFIGTVPGTATRAVMLRTPLSGTPIDPSIPGRYRGQVQVVVRHADAAAGNLEAAQVQRLLTVQSREHYPATSERGIVHLDLCFPRTLPVQYPRLDGNLIEWSQSFDIVWGVQSLG